MPRRKLTEEQVQEIVTSPLSIRQLAEKMGVGYHTIWYCRNNHGREGKRPTGYFQKGENHHSAKLTSEQVRKIYQMGGSTFEISCDYNVSIATIWNIRAGKTWKHVTEGLQSGYKPKGRWNKSIGETT